MEAKNKIFAYLERLEQNPEDLEVLDRLKGAVAELEGEDRSTDLLQRLTMTRANLVDQGAADLALEILELELSLHEDSAVQADLLYEKARILDDEVLDQDAALSCLEKALEIQPDLKSALERVEAIKTTRENWEKIASHYLENAESSESKELTTSLYASTAELYGKNSDDQEKVETYLEKSLDVDPANTKAYRHMVRLLSQQERWEDVAALHRRYADAVSDDAVKIRALLAAARVLDIHAGKLEEALELYRLVLDLDRRSEAALSALVEGYTRMENWEALISVYETILREKGREADQGVLLQIGMLWWRKMENQEAAEPYFKRLAKIDPSSPLVVGFYREYYSALGDYKNLLTVLRQAQHKTQDHDQKLALGVEMAKVAEDELGDLDRAVDFWKGVLRLEAGHPEAKEALKRLYRKAEKWNPLLEVLKDELDALSDDQVEDKVSLLREIADIYGKLGVDVMVLNTFNAILAIQPDNQEVLNALATRYEEADRVNDLIKVLHKQARVAQGPADRKRILRRIAELWTDKVGNFAKAIEPLEEILSIDPADGRALAALKDIYAKRRNWKALLDLSQRELDVASEDQRMELLQEMATLAQQRLGDVRRAIALWNQVLELDDQNAGAIEALAQLYQREKRWPALAEVLERKAASVSDPAERLSLLETLGGLWSDKIGGGPRAIAVWRQVLDIKPDHLKALRVLKGLYLQEGDWQALEELFGVRDKWSELVDTLLEAADRTDDPAEQVTLYFKVARIWEDRLGKPDRAVKAYERVLAVEPGNLDAARALVPIYEKGQKWPRLVSTLQVLLEHTEDTGEQLGLLERIWSTYESKLGAKVDAFNWCAKGYRLSDGDEGIRENLERLAREAHSWKPLVEIYAERVETLEDDDARLALYRRMAELTHQELNDPEGAKGYYREILEHRPADTDALTALEQIHVLLEEWKELLGIYQKRAELAEDGGARVEFLHKAGLIQEEHLQDLDGAAATYEAILEVDPDDMRALRALERVQETREDWQALAGVLGRQLTRITDNLDRIEILFRLGGLQEDRLDDKDAAIESYREILAIDPLHRATVGALERFLEDDERKVAVAEILTPFYERTESWSELGRTLEILAAGSQDDGERLELLRRLADVHARKLGDVAAATLVALNIFEVAPQDEENRALLRELAEVEGEWEAVIDAYEKAIEAAEEGDLKATLALELARIFDEGLGDLGRARVAYEKVLAVDPAHRGAFEALDRILGALEDYEALRTLLHGRAASTEDGEERRELLFRISAISEDVLGDTEGAVETYREILNFEPGNDDAYRALERLYGGLGKWSDLEELLAQELEFVTDPTAVAEIQFRRGQILAKHLGNGEGAVDLFQDVLAAAPEHEGAVGAMEELLDDADLRQKVAGILEPLYEQAGANEQLVHILEVRLEAHEDDPASAVDLLKRIARLQKDLGEVEDALATWRRAVKVMPADQEVREELDMLVAELGQWEDAAEIWQEGLAACDEGDLSLQAEYLLKLATLYEQKVLDPDRAALWYAKLLDLDPSNVETSRLAAQALARLYETSGDWESLVGILRREVDWSDDPEERKQFLFRIAEIQEQYLNDEEGAVETYRTVMELDPEDSSAIDALERLYFRAERWRELVDILQRRASLTLDADERRGLWARVAMLYEEAIEDRSEAIQAWNSLLDEAPDDIEAIRSLARLYDAEERWRDLYDMMDRELALTEDTPSRVAITFKVGRILHRKLNDAERAISRYREVLEMDPEHKAARQALEELLSDDVLALQAAEILEPLYQTESNWLRLCDIYDLRARHAADPAEKVSLYTRIAEIQETGLDDSRGAFDSYGKALIEAVALGEIEQIMSALERLTSQDDRWADLVDVYKLVSEDVLDVSIQEQMRLTVADVSRHRIGDLDVAKEYYRKVLEISPDSERALDALESLYAETEDYEALLDIFKRRADLSAVEPDKHRDYLARAALLCEEVLDRSDDAVDIWEQVLAVVPSDRQAADSLEKLYARSERWADLAELLERRLGFAETIEEAVSLRYRLGELWSDKLEDPDRALLNFRAALGGDPRHVGSITRIETFLEDPDRRGDAAEILEPIYASRQDWARLIEIYEIRRDATDSLDAKPALTRRIAMLYEEQMEDLDKAFDWYGKFFQESPEEPGIRDQLTRLAGILDRWADLAAVYAGYLENVFDEDATTMAVARELADIYDSRLGDVDKAKDYYLRVINADRSDTTVFEALERMLSRAERWKDLLEVYQEAADHAYDPQDRKVLLFKMSQIHEEPLEDPESAVDVYRSILDMGEEEPRAVAALERLLTQLEKWPDLVELYHRQLDYASDSDAVAEIKLKLGALYTKRLGDISAAVDAYEEILRDNPRNEQALGSLEALVLNEDHRFRIAQILEPIYRELDEWKKLVVIYEAELEFIDDRARRVEILSEVAKLHEERGGDHLLAFDAISKAWLEDVSDREILEKTEEMAGRLGDWGRFVAVLQKGAEQSYDAELLADIYRKLARIYERALGDREQAVEAYKKLLEAQEEDMGAIEALERLLSDMGRFEDLVPILSKKAELTVETLEATEIYYKLAEVQETVLERREDAIATWRKVLSLNDSDELALAALERLYQADEAWTELVEVYRRKADLASAPEDRRDILLKLASVFRTQLGEVYEAVAVYNSVLEMFPEDVETMKALDDLYSSEKMWPDLLDVLERRIVLEADPGQRNELIYRAASVLSSEMGDVDGAIDRYSQVLAVDPNHQGARKAIEELAANESAREAAIKVLEPLLEASGEWQTLVNLYEMQLGDETDPVRRVEILSKLASVAESGLTDRQKAFDAYGRALKEEPGNESVQGNLERLALDLGNWQELADLYVGVLGNVYEPELGRKLNKTVARIYEDALEDPAKAAERYREALGFGDDLEVLQALDRLLVRLETWQELAEVLQREVDLTDGAGEQAELFFRMGELRQVRFEDKQGAIDAYNEVLARVPDHAGALAALEAFLEESDWALKVLDILEPAHEALGHYDKVVGLLRRRLGLLSDPVDRAVLLERVAELAEQQLSDPAEALTAMLDALRESPAEVRYVDQVERLADLTGDWARAAQGVEDVITAVEDEAVVRDLALRAARWYVDRLTDVDRAEALYRKVLEVDDSNLDAVGALEAIYRARAEMGGLVAILEKKAEMTYDASGRNTILREIAQIADEILHDPAKAAAAWKAIAEGDIGNAEALDALERLYEAAENWEELAEVLDRKVEMTDDSDEMLRLRHKLGRLYLERMDDADRAVQAFKDALDIQPSDDEALDALEEVYTKQEDWNEVQDVLLRRMTALDPGAARVPVYAKLARLAEERFEDPDEAISYWLQIQQVDEVNDEAYKELSRLFEAQERWYDLAELYQKYADVRAQMGDVAGELEYLVKAAQVWEGRIENTDTATEVLERVLERDPQHVGALTALARMYENAEQWDKCQEVLAQAAAIGASGRQGAELAFRRGMVAEKLGDPEGALTFFQEALELDETHPEALERVEQAARDAGDWKKVAEVVHTRARHAQEPAKQLQYLCELGGLYVERLEYPDGAIPFLQQALEIAPDDPQVLEPLANAYYAAGNDEEAGRLYESLVDRLSKQRRDKRLARYYSRLAGLAERRGERDKALEYYDKAYRIDTTHSPTLVALGRLYMEAEDWDKARRIYRSMLLQNLDESESGMSKADVYYHLGRIHLQTNEPKKAKNMLQRGLELDPDNEQIKALLAEIG